MSSKTNSKVLSREELFEKVWTMPTIKVAEELGISDVAVAKICKKHGIPKPPLGYWSMLKHGKKVKRPELPPLKDEKLKIITIVGSEGYRLYLNKASRPEGTPSIVVVSEALSSPHALVRKTKSAFSEKRVDQYGRMYSLEKEILNISVGLKSFDRALRVMDALIKALDAKGIEVRVLSSKYWQGESWRTAAIVNDEEVIFKMEEPSVRVEVPKNEKDKWSYRTHDYKPSGRLKLTIEVWGIDEFQKVWSDTEKHPIETKLDSFIQGLVLMSGGIKKQNLKRAEEDRRREEQKRLWAEEAEKEKREQKKIQDLLEKTKRWKESQDIMAFLAAMESQYSNRNIAADIETREWLDWAREYAFSISPLSKLEVK